LIHLSHHPFDGLNALDSHMRGFIDDNEDRLGTETARLKNQTRGRERDCARDGTVGVAMNTAPSPYKPLV
jgi:hypothetical protein